MGKFERGKPNPGRKFQPGQSGNPNGKPKAIVEVAAAAREHTVEAIATLHKVMVDEDATSAARVSAAVALLERAWGKPKETVTLLHETDMREMTDAELIALARADRGADTPGSPEGEGKPH